MWLILLNSTIASDYVKSKCSVFSMLAENVVMYIIIYSI